MMKNHAPKFVYTVGSQRRAACARIESNGKSAQCSLCLFREPGDLFFSESAASHVRHSPSDELPVILADTVKGG